MSKEELIEAQGADFKIFEEMNTKGDGAVTKNEFLKWTWQSCIKKERKKNGQGTKWLSTFCRTLERNIKAHFPDSHFEETK